jgi:copper oxidase (laccase) domain-containing protein
MAINHSIARVSEVRTKREESSSMSYRQLIKLIDGHARVQEDLMNDCSSEENSLPLAARAQRRELECKADLHNTFADALRDISAEAETEDGVVTSLKNLSTDLLARSCAPSFSRAGGAIEGRLIAGFRATIAAILSQATEKEPSGALPAHLTAELEALSEGGAIEALNFLRTKHGWAGSPVTTFEVREEPATALPRLTVPALPQ